jgi:hypothetical protein
MSDLGLQENFSLIHPIVKVRSSYKTYAILA